MASTTIRVKPVTDIWRKPPAINVHTAPTALIQQVHSAVFHKARVTVSAEWARLYDQGGLYVSFPQFFEDGKKQGWLKTGIEFHDDIPNLSTAAAREWADWSLVPLRKDQRSVTIELERKEATDPSLWVYLILDEEKRIGVREITWAFESEGELQIGVYAARETVNSIGEESLEVTFENFSVTETQ